MGTGLQFLIRVIAFADQKKKRFGQKTCVRNDSSDIIKVKIYLMFIQMIRRSFEYLMALSFDSWLPISVRAISIPVTNKIKIIYLYNLLRIKYLKYLLEGFPKDVVIVKKLEGKELMGYKGQFL